MSTNDVCWTGLGAPCFTVGSTTVPGSGVEDTRYGTGEGGFFDLARGIILEEVRLGDLAIATVWTYNKRKV